MGETNYTLASDLSEARKMADSLEDYIQTEPIYATVGGGFFTGGTMPAMTTGALLLRVQRLRAQADQMTDSQRQQLEGIEAEIARIRRTWTKHFDDKVERETRSRVRSLSQYFEDLHDDPRAAANAWLPEALRRTIVYVLDLTMQEHGIDRGDLPQRIQGIDGALRRHTEKAPFVWSNELQAVYPETPYWWLYVRPPQPKK